MRLSTAFGSRLIGGLTFFAVAAHLGWAAEAVPSGSREMERTAALLAVAPRSGLPPDKDDPARPPQIRLLKPGVWTDDVGIDDNGNIYNQYKRSSVGTWSNYEESRANPYPVLPDPLTLKNGQPVRDAATWWNQRRPEILGDFYAEIYGRIPAAMPKITWEIAAVTTEGATRTKTIVGHIDNSAYPQATPAINLTLTLPAKVSGPVPVMVVISAFSGGGPRRGGAPANPSAPGGAATRTPAPAPRPSAGPSPKEQILARGWAMRSSTPRACSRTALPA